LLAVFNGKTTGMGQAPSETNKSGGWPISIE
jgi:hypothetical protein